MSRKCPSHVDAFDRFEQQFFHLLCQNMFSSTHNCSLSVNTRQIFYWKDEASQIFVRIRCMLAKHCGRISMGQTGKTSPRSMVQPQQIHLVPLGHMTHVRELPSGLFMGVSWCSRANRVSFELMVTAQLISSKHMLGLPIFDACSVVEISIAS